MDLENNNMCVVYTVGKGYHNPHLTADKTSTYSQQQSVHCDDFTDLAAIQEQNDSDWNFSQDEQNSSRNSLAESYTSAAAGTSNPFETYLRPEMAYRSHSRTSGDMKTVTFNPDADQIVHLSPTRSVTSSPSIHSSSDGGTRRFQQSEHNKSETTRQLETNGSSVVKDDANIVETSMDFKSDTEPSNDLHLTSHSQTNCTIPEVEILSTKRVFNGATEEEQEFEF